MADPRDSILNCIETLENLVRDSEAFAELTEDQRVALLSAAGRISRPDRTQIRLRNRTIHRSRRQKLQTLDKSTRAQSGIRQARQDSVFTAPKPTVGPNRPLANPRNCYICKAEYREMHHFYDSMCLSCAEFNYTKRFQSADLTGTVAVITGARLKIGYQAALMLLRAGARVVVSTRFPVDAANRYAKEADFSEWGDRLEIYGLDLRHSPSVEIFCQYLLSHLPRLDFLINNAAQTVRRPPGFYHHLIGTERTPVDRLDVGPRQLLANYEACKSRLLNVSDTQSPMPVAWNSVRPGVGMTDSAELSQIPYSFDGTLSPAELFPAGSLDADLQQVDLREINSWRLGLAEVHPAEMIEVQLVNSVAPFILCARLTPLMRKDPTGQKHIVNVSAMEGKFTRYTKTERHPHTNMAKAALNMLTHTSARELIKDGIHLNAVDTGWVTDEDPAQLSLRKQKDHDFQPPLDIVDGAARIVDPIIDGINSGVHWNGRFLKDYVPTDW